MKWNYFLLIFIHPLITESHAYVQVYQNSQNWTEAYHDCLVKEGRLANPDELVSCPTVSTTMNIWLGTYDHKRVSPWIANMGCYIYKDNGRNTKSTKATMEECYTSCRSTVFGYNKPWCSCEDTTIVVNPSSDSACLAEQPFDNLWLYNRTEIDMNENNLKLNCLTAQCTENGTIFKATNCSSQRQALCQHDDSSNLKKKLYTQTSSEKMCNKNHTTHLITKGLCLSLYPNEHTEKKGPEFWTGMQRFQYSITEKVTDFNRQEVKSADIFNCVYVKCPTGSGSEAVGVTANCGQQMDGFACIFNGSGSVDHETTVTQSLENTFETTTSNTPVSSSMQFEYKSTLVSPKPTIENSDNSSVSAHIQTNTESSIPPPNVTTQLTSEHTSETVTSTSSATKGIKGSSIPAVTKKNVTQNLENTFETTTSNTPVSSSMQFEYKSTLVSPKPTIENSDNSSVSAHIQTNTESSIPPPNVTTQLTSEHTSETVTSTSSATTGINGSSIPAVTKKNVTLQQTVLTKGKSSLPTFQQSKIGSSTLPSNGIIPSTPDHTVEPVASTSDDAKGIAVSTVSTTNIDIIKATFSSVKTSKYVTKNSKGIIMDNTTTPHSNSVQSKNLNTGLVVGVSVSILIVVMIGLLGICRLMRNRGPIKGNLEDTESPMTLDKDPNYHGIYFDSESKTSDLKNKYENDALKSSDDDMQFRMINSTLNSVKDTPDNAYAVVVKKQVTTKANNNQDKDTNIPSNTFESDYDILNQPKGSSGNESGNIYDTSEGHLDDKDPTDNTTAHISARVTGNESDYDHM